MTKSRISIWVAAAVLLAGCSTGTPDSPSPSPNASDQIARQFQTWMVGLPLGKHDHVCNMWSYAPDLLLEELTQGVVIRNARPWTVDVQIPPGTPVTTAEDAFTDVLERECY